MDPEADGHAGYSPLRAYHYTSGIIAVLELHGEADASTRAVLRQALTDALNRHPRALVIDLGGISFCDGGCAQDLLAVTRLRRVGVVQAQGTVTTVLDLLDPVREVQWVPLPLDSSEAGSHDEGGGAAPGS